MGCLTGALLTVAIVAAPAAASERLQIAPSHASVEPGQTLHFQAAGSSRGSGEGSGPAPAVRWQIVSGPGSLSADGVYRAPYVVPGASSAIIRASTGPKGVEISDQATIELRPGAYPGADSCAGDGQDHVPAIGEYVDLDELPVAITTVTPVYPASARARGIAASLMVNALVCRSGHVLDAVPTWGLGSTPVGVLEDAAIDAARQWVFKPGTVAGRPVATWIAIPFVFKP